MSEEQRATDEHREYRSLLTRTEQDSQAEFDKALLALSGGGLALSFTFAKDIVGMATAIHLGCLIGAWIAWTLSSTSILLSFYTSILALRKAIRQLDEAKFGIERPGGAWDSITKSLNFVGLLLFVCGLTMMVFFLSYNLRIK